MPPSTIFIGMASVVSEKASQVRKPLGKQPIGRPKEKHEIHTFVELANAFTFGFRQKLRALIQVPWELSGLRLFVEDCWDFLRRAADEKKLFDIAWPPACDGRTLLDVDLCGNPRLLYPFLTTPDGLKPRGGVGPQKGPP